MNEELALARRAIVALEGDAEFAALLHAHADDRVMGRLEQYLETRGVDHDLARVLAHTYCVGAAQGIESIDRWLAGRMR